MHIRSSALHTCMRLAKTLQDPCAEVIWCCHLISTVIKVIIASLTFEAIHETGIQIPFCESETLDSPKYVPTCKGIKDTWINIPMYTYTYICLHMFFLKSLSASFALRHSRHKLSHTHIRVLLTAPIVNSPPRQLWET